MRISVLLPYRDAGGTVDEALQSVLAEPGDFEVIAVDDGSTDDGPARVRAIAARDGRVIEAASGGVGIAAALQHAAGLARGSLLARMDADDVSIPGRLAEEAALLESDARLGVVGTLVEAFGEGPIGGGTQRYVAWLNSLVTPEDHERDLFVESPLCHPSTMIRRAALEAAGGYRAVPWAEDYDLWLRIAAAGWALAKAPRVGLRWRQHARRATLLDARYSHYAFHAAKGHYLAPRLERLGKPVAMWGAGKTGKRIGRALARCGVRPELYVDIDPLKVGRLAQGAPIVAPRNLPRGRHSLVVAVGAPGARATVRSWLGANGFVEGRDFLCAS